uniref:DUF7515 domain-containing protein n=1 Tax=Meloidogyne enterolobii TaxID=390850 RepID=A0A6V7VSA7_MELEN|nr:unnamed protein product [Meloidogyne enterolobii]
MENRVRREKISLEKFGYYLFTLLNSKDDGYDSLTELIKDFINYHKYDPEEQAILLKFSSLKQLLESKEMFKFVNVLRTTNEKGEKVTVYMASHDINAIKQGQRLAVQEIERRQKKNQFFQQKNQVLQDERNREPQRENCRPNGMNQNGKRYPMQQHNGRILGVNQQPRGNTLPRQPYSNPAFEPLRTLAEIRNDQIRQQQQRMINNEKEASKTSKKNVATETEKTCTKCICTECARFAQVLHKFVDKEKEKTAKKC